MAELVRLRGPLAADSTAQMLHLLLVVIAAWTAVAFVVTLGLAPITLYRIVFVGLLELSLLAALLLLRFGHLRTAATVYLAGTFYWATISVSLMGGIRSPTLLLYVTLPVSAAWLFGLRGIVLTTTATIGAILIFASLEMAGVPRPRYILGTPLGIWSVAVQSILIGTIPVGIVLRRLRETLTELQEHQQHLEEIVERRTAELVQARDQAQEANRIKTVFLANMSHELRTPLNAILGFSHLLLEREISPEKRADLEVINRGGEHLLSLVNDVLDVAKIEAGRTVIDLAPCDLHVLVKDIVEMMHFRAEKKGLALSLSPTPHFPHYAQTDAARLRQILINLIENAIKYTHRGSIEVRLDARPAGDPAMREVIIEVEDTGAGIPASDHNRIFEAFEQSGSGIVKTGTGLGLTITRRIIDLMGGKILLRSSPGEGSCFRVSLPMELSDGAGLLRPVAERRRVERLEPDQPEFRILIVEDEPENWIVLERLLKDAGFVVSVAENGAQGVAKFRDWNPHFIWMDLRMPVMDGLEAARRIRSMEGGLDVKIAAVTASGFVRRRSEILSSGIDDYVSKPYLPQEIFECMQRHLGVRYLYGGPDSSPTSLPDLNPEDLQSIPEDLRQDLRQALISLDSGRVADVIQRISEVDEALAKTLSTYAAKLAYTPILRATSSGDGVAKVSP